MSFKNLLNKIRFYFKDCYGLDKFSSYLLIGGVILSSGRFTSLLGYAIVGYALWRMLSKNKAKRYQELAGFEAIFMSWKKKLFNFKASVKEYKEYKIFKCPNCSQKLRVPRKKGRLIITCKTCETKFKGKS